MTLWMASDIDFKKNIYLIKFHLFVFAEIDLLLKLIIMS